MEQQIVVKSESQDNSQILLFYVDGSEEPVEAIVPDNVMTSVQQVEEMEEQMETEQTYYIEETTSNNGDENDDLVAEFGPEHDVPWHDDDTRRLLIFYIDNKETFTNGFTRRRVLWSVACRTMLLDKTPVACEMKLTNLKGEYVNILLNHKNGSAITWPHIEMAHQAFHDDSVVQSELVASQGQSILVIENQDQEMTLEDIPEEQVIGIEDVNNIDKQPFNRIEYSEVTVQSATPSQKKSVVDEKIIQMLKLYMKHSERLKKIQRHVNNKLLWETIASEMGETDAEYLHHRFMNYKQHYVRILNRKLEKGDKADIKWPYIEYYDQIYLNDPEFRRKYLSADKYKQLMDARQPEKDIEEWHDAEKTVLVKYYFDCYSEFQDKTIPKGFLWSEVGRLLDKEAKACQDKYKELRDQHIDKIIQCQYNFSKRIPLEILFDNIIARDVQNMLGGRSASMTWSDLEQFVKLVYDNINLFKDDQGYYVIWEALSVKFKASPQQCLDQWSALRNSYKSVLFRKKENSDMEIDWQYMDMFDKIYDYGMDTKLLTGYEKLNAKTVEIDKDQENAASDTDYETKGYRPRYKSSEGDAKAFKILEFYLKHKDKFSTTARRKQALWEELARKIGISAVQCAHRFRNLKQVYRNYVERELTKPEMPIVWPYYDMCKKLFGYSTLKKKLKEKLEDSDDNEEWTSRDIKRLIVHLSNNFVELSTDYSESQWTELAKQIDKSESACRDKFLELRKSYRLLKTKITRYPSVNITWKYFHLFDEVFSSADGRGRLRELMRADELDDEGLEDDEYQCIIVMPEGQEDASNMKILETLQKAEKVKSKKVTQFNKNSTKSLLTHYLTYLKEHENEEISGKVMWKEISKKIPNKTPVTCKKMLVKLKKTRQANPDAYKDTQYHDLLEEIIKLKPKFKKAANKDLETTKVYTDYSMPQETVQQALEYYLKNVDEFANPRFEKKYAWTDLAKELKQPLSKIFNKINYILDNYKKTQMSCLRVEDQQFEKLIKQIVEREEGIRNNAGEIKKDDQDEEVQWSEDETEQLLNWYLANLEKFKNPKFVRRYLWLEASTILNKSALSCSKQMSEIRTQYRTLVKERPEELKTWRFNVLCQKIYGTGKQKS